MVRKGGFEPPRSCERQPLKLVRLPVPPLPHVTKAVLSFQLQVVSAWFSFVVTKRRWGGFADD